MLKQKVIQVIIVLALVLFSFYYTNKTIELIRETDPIMKKIKEESKKYEIKAENAQIVGNKITSGKNGLQVDYKETYQKMKRYGTYNEALTVFKEINPTISIEDNYDLFVTGGNQEKKAVALVFTVTDEIDPKEIIRMLNQSGVSSTFFIDGLWLENNLDLVKEMSNFELEILSYNNRYEEIYFSSALKYLKNITGKEASYCYAEYDNKEVIELCSKLKLHTIIPTLKITSSPFMEVKEKLENASIISFKINEITKNELPATINYINSKGYNLVTLKELLNEQLEK